MKARKILPILVLAGLAAAAAWLARRILARDAGGESLWSRFRRQLRERRDRAEVYSRADYWDRKAAAHDGFAVSMWPNQALNRLYHEEQLAAFRSLVPEVAGLRVLDVGCGTGRVARALAKEGAEVTGVDFAPKVIELARGQTLGPNPRFAVGSVFDSPGELTGPCDLVLTWGVLTVACRTAGDLDQALRNLRAALRPGGRLFCLEPIHAGPLHRVLDLPLADFLAALERAGFRVLATRQVHFWPARLLLAYVRWPAWLTLPLYHAGQFALGSFFRGQGGGDYKAILAEG